MASDLTPLTLEAAQALIAQGRSPDTDTYVQQCFAIEAYADDLDLDLAGWPSEAVDHDQRIQNLTQDVASIVGDGPYEQKTTALTNGQVLAADEWMDENPQFGENPVYARALVRAAHVAAQGKPDAGLPWPTTTTRRTVNVGGNFGVAIVSGPYGNPKGKAA